jgi:hypothetical protein
VLLGSLIGLAIAVGLGWMIYAGARRINYGIFFRLTGLALVFIAAGLLSHAVHELIEIGAIGVGTGIAFDISSVLPDDAGVGLFLRPCGLCRRAEHESSSTWGALVPVRALSAAGAVAPAQRDARRLDRCALGDPPRRRSSGAKCAGTARRATCGRS